MNWKKTLLTSDANLEQAISNLDTSALQIAMVVGPDGAFQGTITDGDIRRGLLNGLKLSDSITHVVNRSPLVVPPNLDRITVLKMMQVNTVRQLPIIDENRKPVGLHLLNELMKPASRSNFMVIMAGGQGARLRPHTENCPKPLLPVDGKPMLEHIILRALSQGYKNFVITTHYLGHMIEEYFGSGKDLGINIEYLREDTPLGTAGALSLLKPRPQECFVVSNGDVLTDIDYGELLEFHQRQNAAATMAVRLHEWQNPFGVVHTNGFDITGFEEKPTVSSRVNAGIYVLEPEILDLLESDQHCDMPHLFLQAQEQGKRCVVFPMHEPWLDVGRPDDLEKASAARLNLKHSG
ncbi:nucleotidyltransferase family protein [Desulfonatronovibrio magnus]|uniref:nucleotidyltransferase family protein n=1 Tax=Desulfonatronovibrio magnus TaxID=698827 RepID=UPI0005EBDF21|nr:nucleotidyltransferase family protein [Desulfonatronovibrio magnus]